MTQQRRAYGVVGTFFLIMLVVFGPGNTVSAVLFTPLIHEFGWSHAEVAWNASVITAVIALSGPLVGWLIDRVGAQWLIGAGLLIVGCAEVAVSHIHTLRTMVLAFGVFGLGASLAGGLTMMVVTLNWFKQRPGVAMGMFVAGAAVGMTAAPPFLTWVISHWGWRLLMRWLSVPVIFVALPITLAVVRSRPPSAGTENQADRARDAAGLELSQAVHTATFWQLLVVQFLFAAAFTGVFPHQITFLIGAGYSPQHAAWIFSAQTFMSGPGVLFMGWLADRFGARPALAGTLICLALGALSLMGTAFASLRAVAIPAFAIFWGASVGFNTVLPILVSETLGLRRLGTLTGVIHFGSALAMAVAPVIAGRIFDVTGSYFPAFELAIALAVLTAGLTFTIHPAGEPRLVAAVMTDA
jgi:MFS family permease